MDDDTRKTIEYGERIRSCLKQAEFTPVSVAGQIAVLLALTSGLFESVPLERMPDAENSVRKAALEIEAELRNRLESGDKLSDEDRVVIVELARQAIAKFIHSPAIESDETNNVDSDNLENTNGELSL